MPFVKLGEEVNYLPKPCPGRVAVCKARENQRETTSQKIDVGTGCVPASQACLEWPSKQLLHHCPAGPVYLVDRSSDRQGVLMGYVSVSRISRPQSLHKALLVQGLVPYSTGQARQESQGRMLRSHSDDPPSWLACR